MIEHGVSVFGAEGGSFYPLLAVDFDYISTPRDTQRQFVQVVFDFHWKRRLVQPL